LDKTENAEGLLIINVHPYPPEQEYGKFSIVSSMPGIEGAGWVWHNAVIGPLLL
jgi:hypothetical protein